MAPTLEDQDRLIVNKFAYRLHDPEVGDIVMLLYPEDPRKSFVKRVMGAPGDTIRIVDGRVFRNDVLQPDDYIPDEFRSRDQWGPQTIPSGYYFVMGDHRNNSSDSRTWSFVPQKYIIGKVQVRWWPLDQARLFDHFE
jgi:signal peptidase I